MRFDKERCIKCGSALRTQHFSSAYNKYGNISSNGTHIGTDYWFCSGKCYDELIDSTLPLNYRSTATGEDDPHLRAVFNDVNEDDNVSREEAIDKIRDALNEWKRARDSAQLVGKQK